MPRGAGIVRTRIVRAGMLISALMLMLAVAGCGAASNAPWHSDDITGIMPPLEFTMDRADDGKTVTAADYKGKVTLLYFGYTFCPDICPTTLSNVALILQRLGSAADGVRFLFVTVDPNRDTPDVLKQYADAFAPQVDGLRGTPDQLAALAKRYRVSYAVTPSADPEKYKVLHSSAIYVFDKSGTVRLMVSSLGTSDPDNDGTVADLKRLLAE